MSEWDRLEREEFIARANNVVPINDDMPDWMNDVPPYEGEQPEIDEPLILISPSQWSGKEPPERRWKVKDYIPDGQATLLTGKGAAGKSLVSQLMCTCIAMGMPFLGLEVERCNTLYITCEDDQDELERRQKAICAGLGIDAAATDGKLFLLSLHGEISNELATFTIDGRMSVASMYRRVVAACQANSINLLVLDNTAHLFTGNENDRHQVAAFINLCNRMATAIGGAVIIVGHPNKAGDSYSGSTAWENQVRSRLFMEIPNNDNGAVENSDARVMKREKANYAQRGGELNFVWHKGTFVLPDHIPPAATNLAEIAADARDNAIFIACLETRNKQLRAVSESNRSSTFAPKVFAEMVESNGIGRARLDRAMDRLFRIEVIERGFLWVHKGEAKPCHGLRIVEKNRSKVTPITSPITSDDIGAENTKSNKINPITSKSDVIGAKPRNGGNPPDNISDNMPITSDDIADDIPLSLKGEDRGAPSILGMGGTPIQGSNDDFSEQDFGEPPAWMDDAPPLAPPESIGAEIDHLSGADWLDNPILNPRSDP